MRGKTSRRSHARSQGRAPLHLVSAGAARQRLVLGQEAIDRKSNEITAIPLLLERLELDGALVTIDALGTRTDIAEKIVERGGDYLLSLKVNRPLLHEDVARSRTGHGPQNMAVIEHMAMNLVRSPRISTTSKLANLNPGYLETLVRRQTAST